jgi:hypothetical protein
MIADMPIKVGTYVRPDGWGLGNCLTAGLEGFCDFYLPTNSGGPIKEVAVNVEVTGRTMQRREGSYWVRVKITFVGDGEPDVVVRGWTPYQWGY